MSSAQSSPLLAASLNMSEPRAERSSESEARWDQDCSRRVAQREAISS